MNTGRRILNESHTWGKKQNHSAFSKPHLCVSSKNLLKGEVQRCPYCSFQIDHWNDQTRKAFYFSEAILFIWHKSCLTIKKKSSKPPICLYLCTSLAYLFIHAVTAQNLLMLITSLLYLHIESNTILAMWVTVNFVFIWCLTSTCIDILPQITWVLCKWLFAQFIKLYNEPADSYTSR